MAMTKQEAQDQLIKAISDLREEMKSDSDRIWAEINILNKQVSTGKGAVKALMWLGGLVGAFAAYMNSFRHS